MDTQKILALTDVSICCIEMIFMFVCLCGCSNDKDVILSTAWGQWKYSTSVASADVSAQIGVNLMGYALKGSISGLGSESTSGTWVDAYKNDDPTSDYDYCSSYDGTYTYGGDPSDSIDAYAARPKEAAVPTRARAPRPPRARCAQRALPPPPAFQSSQSFQDSRPEQWMFRGQSLVPGGAFATQPASPILPGLPTRAMDV